jgi:DNA-binding NtrC family response regulator
VSDDLIGASPAMQHLRGLIARVGPHPSTVLIVGESGAGKELVAQGLHRASPRRNGPLVALNCGAIAPSLVEAELFGHRKGGFTGAVADRPGLFEQADDGTLFLDEIGELPLDCQVKLLRVIETKAFRPVGASADVRADVRILAATNRDLEKEVEKGTFRHDLYYRLRVIVLPVPPLRDHAEDVPALVEHFLARLAVECGRQVRLSDGALRRLQGYSWPGNVRQLRAILENAVVLSEHDTVGEGDLLLPAAASCPATPGDGPASLNLADVEAWAIRQALRRTGGKLAAAAQVLGIVRETLTTKMKKYGIDKE